MTTTKQRIAALVVALMVAVSGAFAVSATFASDAYAVGSDITVSPTQQPCLSRGPRHR